MISPSDLPWWGWMLCSLGAWIAFGFAAQEEQTTQNGLFAILAGITGLVGLVTGGIAVTLFVKWVWSA
jgi:FtsH-binding integral membrane protein